MVNNLLTFLPLLRPLGAIYGLLMRLRAFLYAISFFKSYSLPVPVISVGNLTMGGSGKTPIVIYLAKYLQHRGFRPAVVSRGYGGKAFGKINVVSDGSTLLLDCIEAGDEPRLIAEKAMGVVVLTGKKRIYPCQYAVSQLDCDIIILDDGFQHLSVNRDIDLVLFSASTNLKYMHVLPGGVLREPFSALTRASSLVVSGCSDDNFLQAQSVVSFLQRRRINRDIFQLKFPPAYFVDGQGETFGLDSLHFPVFAFCGIASPTRFLTTLKNLALDITGFSHFSDHQEYSEESLKNVAAAATKQGAKALVTTEKDLVKLKNYTADLPLYALCMEVETSATFESYIIDKISALG